MEKRLLWVFLVALLGVNLWMIQQREVWKGRAEALRVEAASAFAEQRYAEEEEALILGLRTVPDDLVADLAGGDGRGGDDGSVYFLLFAGLQDCSNCIEDEVAKLNELVLGTSPRVGGAYGFFVDEEESGRQFMDHIRPAPVFPFRYGPVLERLPGATTPLVLVVRAADHRILDAHKPIPEDLSKRDAFYARWNEILKLSDKTGSGKAYSAPEVVRESQPNGGG